MKRYIRMEVMKIMKKEFLLLTFLSILLINILNAGSVCDVAKFKMEWSNWSVLALIAAFISIGFVSMLYMIGSFIKDDSLKARASIEFGQLLITLILIAIVFGMVNFLCSDAIGSALLGAAGIQSRMAMVDYTEYYFKLLTNYSAASYIKAFLAYSVLAWLSSYEAPTKSSTFKIFNIGMMESIDIIKGTLSFFFSMIIGSFVLSIANRFVLYYSLLLGLYFFIPIGIVMRAFFPTRRFGGALLGIGIALVLFFPFIFFINAIFLASTFESKMPELLPQIYCGSDNLICYSKVCDPSGVCGKLINDGEICYSTNPSSYYYIPSVSSFSELNLRCSSGRCKPKSTLVIDYACADSKTLKNPGDECDFDWDCKPGSYCNSTVLVSILHPTVISPGICKPSKDIGESCTRDEECEKGRGERACINGVCNYTKMVGESCSRHTECNSLYCNAGKCDYSAATAEVFNFDMFREGEIGGTASFPVVGNPYKSSGGIFETISLIIIASYALSIVNYMLLGYVMRDLSGFFGMEVTLEDLYRLI